VELHAKIARVSMLGLIPDHPEATVHPFFGFDPRRVYEESGHNAPWDLSQLQSAVMDHGFIGVKVYPPMGWRPSRNFTTEDIRSQAEATAYDQILTEFFGWCDQHQVPVTPHANRSMGTEAAYDEFSSPFEWKRVLDRFPGLRINLGHFGGFDEQPTSNTWPYYFAELAEQFDNVYVDVGNHRPHEATILQRYLARLDQLLAAFPNLTEKIMLGTDWYMDVQEPNHEDYVGNYLKAYENKFGTDATKRFYGRNALDFLGLGDPANKNNQRLRAYYAEHAPGREPDWLED
jgi:predicted TIM-barrel fold metal-dependent hydrolase